MKGKKGLANGLLAVIIVLFIFALFSLISLAGWNLVNNTFQDADNETISPQVKEQIDDLGVFMGWGDTIFVMFFIALLIGFMVTSLTVSSDKTIYIIFYFMFLVLITILSMILSNAWSYLIENPNFVEAAAELSFTTWIFTYLPVITLFMGVIGGIIFYARKRTGSPVGDGFNVDFKGGGEGL